MYQYLVELYTPNAKWKALAIIQRKEFLESISNGMSKLTSMGVEVLTLTEVVPDTDKGGEHQFLAIWRFPDTQIRDALLAGIKASGWYDYFIHVNVAGGEGDLSQHLARLEMYGHS